MGRDFYPEMIFCKALFSAPWSSFIREEAGKGDLPGRIFCDIAISDASAGEKKPGACAPGSMKRTYPLSEAIAYQKYTAARLRTGMNLSKSIPPPAPLQRPGEERFREWRSPIRACLP